MTFAAIQVPPGVVKSESNYSASGRWIDMDHVRFDGDKPQKIGGTQKFFTDTFTGIARAAEAWSSYTGAQCLMWGTACRLYLYREGTLSTITPYRTDATAISLTNPFTGGSVRNFPYNGENDSFTKILLHMDGADASTTFQDINVGGSAHTWTAVGNAQIDTAQSVFGGASGLFDGTGDWITTPDHADFVIGGGNFTVDLWFRVAGGDGSQLFIAGQMDVAITASLSSFLIFRNSSNKIQCSLSNGTTFTAISTTASYSTASNPGWHHLEYTRSGSNLFLFIDGVLGASGTFSGTVPDSASILAVGTAGALGALGWNGWIDEFRMSIGVARHIVDFTPPAAAYRTNTTVTVADVAHGITAAGVVVNFSGFSAGAGITISGDYEVAAILDADSFTITHPEAATSAFVAGFGGTGTARYTLNCGNVDSSYLVGWGVGTWGTGTGWGTSASLASALVTEPTNWSFDVFGEDLVVNQLNNGIWIYDTSTGATRPTLLAGAPTQVRFAFVTAERYIFALGCTLAGGGFDPMTVRWPDILVTTDWVASSTNTANQRKLQGGTRLMAGTALSPGVSVVWSDSSLFIFQFTGAGSTLAQPVYGSRKVADKCGLAAQHAFTKAGGIAYWMSESNFWMYTGSAQPIPNVDNIRGWVFENVNKSHILKSYAFYNSVFNEVWFVFPGIGSTEPSLYVMVQLDTYAWAHGTWDRSAAATFTVSEDRPIMFGNTTGTVYLHEVKGLPTNDGAALPCHIELAPTDVQDGNVCVDIYGFIPDFQTQTGDFELYLYGLDHPRDAVAMSETLMIGPTDKFVDARCAGRQFGLILTGNDADCDFRMGKWGLDIQGAGVKRGSRAAP